MAKQRGIHQISGKINNLCYYEQKYVRGGLIRRINEAMSGRLKTDPVFANTRSANSFFGAFSIISKIILSFAGFRATTLMYPSRQAKLTKRLRDVYVLDFGLSYSGSIGLEEANTDALLYSLNSLAKVKYNLYFPTLNPNYKGIDHSSGFNLRIPEVYLVGFCRAFKVERIQFEFHGANSMDVLYFDASTGKYSPPNYDVARVISTHIWDIGDGDLDHTFRFVEPGYPLALAYLSILPVRDGSGATARFNTSGAIGFYIAV